jgi:dTDP-4-dehydrorhamnose reductase
MLGHKLWQIYRDQFDTWATVRSSHDEYLKYNLFDPKRLLSAVEVSDFPTVVGVFEKLKPNVVINCVGINKQLPTAKDPLVSIMINALFPHRLAQTCKSIGARLIHISTDCVFSGRKGMYDEKDVPDADDIYGRSKLLGEVPSSNCLTLRTSLIGRELRTTHGLVEWFLSNRGRSVRGYTNAIFTGFPTLTMAHIIGNVIKNHPNLSGVYHVSTDPISKYQLLCLFRDTFQVPVEIEPCPSVNIDRSLDSSRFRGLTGFTPSSWLEMVAAMIKDSTPYEKWRQHRAS